MRLSTAATTAERVAIVGGVRLGPYEILGPLGKGGMGEVYRARDTRLDREVVIKVLPAETHQNADHLARFEREARAVAALNHPNILSLHDFGTHARIAYVVTELLEGETLRERLSRSGAVPIAKALDFAIQIARGLAAAHERGIVHRDLKPENLFVTRDDRVKILDFGLARWDPSPEDEISVETTQITTPGIVLGTPGYLAPEQIVGEPATAQSDLFAFGVVVHEMLTGRHPFLRKTLTGTFRAVLKEDAPPLEGAASAVPSSIAKLLERCLEKHEADRPESARDLALYLQAIASQSQRLPAAASDAVGRLRRRLLLISCGVLLLLSALTWTFVRVMADRAVTASIDAELVRAERMALGVQHTRLSSLALRARLVASFPELKALLATDAPTVRDFLVSYQQRNPEVPALIAIDARGRIVARTDEPAGVEDTGWLAPLLERRGEPATVTIAGRPHHAAAAPADAGGTIFGYIVGVMPVDARFGATLRDATQDEILVLADTAVLSSTLRAGQTSWRSRSDWQRAGGSVEHATDVTLGTQEFRAREVILSDAPRVSAIVLKSRGEASEPFRRIQAGIVLIGFLCVAIAAAGAVWTARVSVS